MSPVSRSTIHATEKLLDRVKRPLAEAVADQRCYDITW